jgi:hypothetical protein
MPRLRDGQVSRRLLSSVEGPARGVQLLPLAARGAANPTTFKVTRLSLGGLRTMLVNATQMTLACVLRAPPLRRDLPGDRRNTGRNSG